MVLMSLMALLAAGAVQGQADGFAQGRAVDGPRQVLEHRDRFASQNAALDQRLENLLPALMDETGIDMWLVISREYVEDPLHFTLVPQPTFAARRTTMLVFHRTAEGVDALTVNRYPLGAPYEAAWEGGDLDEQWKALAGLIAEKSPQAIGINRSENWALADGLTAGLHERLTAALRQEDRARLTSAEELAVRWAETRSPQEMASYGHVVGLARMVIGEAFSSRVITPGVTHTDDVVWYIRQRFSDLGLEPWFLPSVDLQRRENPCGEDDTFCGGDGVIMPGDVIHTDVGICYLRLCTDTQEMGYVARLGEEGVPEGLKAALATGNQWQDHLTSSFKTGRTGNEVLRMTRRKCDRSGLDCATYTHPIGYVGHAPGTTIGMWDNQERVPVSGDWPLHENTCYAIEGNTKAQVPEWDGNHVQIKLEQSACFDGGKVDYLAGRQTRWHLIQ